MPEFPISSARILLFSQIQGGQLPSLPPCPVRLCWVDLACVARYCVGLRYFELNRNDVRRTSPMGKWHFYKYIFQLVLHDVLLFCSAWLFSSVTSLSLGSANRSSSNNGFCTSRFSVCSSHNTVYDATHSIIVVINVCKRLWHHFLQKKRVLASLIISATFLFLNF